MSEGRDEATLSAFFDELSPARTAALEAVVTDMAAWYIEAIAARAPEAAVCIDPFHVVALANRALDEVAERSGTARGARASMRGR